MKIGDKLLKVLNKKYRPVEMFHQKFERYDISFKTDEAGSPVLLFIGKRNELGQIRGERFVKVIVKDSQGNILREHWDNKGRM